MMLRSSVHDQCGRLSSPRTTSASSSRRTSAGLFLVQQQQTLRAPEQAVLHVQIGQLNHNPSAMSGSTQTPRQR